MVMPNCPLVYYPDVSQALATVVFLLSKLAQLAGVKTVQQNMLFLLYFIVMVVFFYAFHLIFCFFGI